MEEEKVDEQPAVHVSEEHQKESESQPEQTSKQTDEEESSVAEKPVQQHESLISDTCAEKFAEPGFEFSVETQQNQNGETEFQREITIKHNDSPTEEQIKDVSPEHSIVTVTEVTKEFNNNLANAGEASVTIVENISVNPPGTDDKVMEVVTELKEEVELIPTQHSPSRDSTIPAEPEATLELKPQAIEAQPVGDNLEPEKDIATCELVDDGLAVSNKPGERSASTPPSIASADHVESKKRHLFHFKVKPFKRSKSGTSKSVDKPPREFSPIDFKSNIRNIFGTIRRTVTSKPKLKASQSQISPVKRPPRPPPLSSFTTYNSRKGGRRSLNDIEQQSLQSTSGPNSPEVSKRELIYQAQTDFHTAMPTDTAQNHDSATQEAILANVAADIAQSTQPSDGAPIQEKHIEPRSSQQQSPQEKPRLAHKPPRPQSPPALSPLDYQPYHDPLVGQRMAMMNRMAPSGTQSVHSDVYGAQTHGGSQVKRLQYQSSVPLSTEIGPYSEYSMGSPSPVRRAQTLRRDYASLVRERVRSLRVEPDPTSATSPTTGTLKPKARKENYVCSETIKLPKFSMRLKRRSTLPVKPIYAKGTEPVRMQPRVFSDYYQPVSETHSGDYVMVSQVGVVQSAAPRSVQLPHQNEARCVPTRQLTSLRSVGAHNIVRQQTYLMDSSKKGLLHLGVYRESPQTTEAIKTNALPYISGSLPHETHTNEQSIVAALNLSQPILNDWAKQTDQSEEQVLDQLKQKMSDFIKVCVRLRSADLQGQFAPFHYPLPSFDPRQWGQCGNLKEWMELAVLREPEWDTEYLFLDPSAAAQKHLFYPERAIDTMLTNWLDFRATYPLRPDCQGGTNNIWMNSTPVFHPITVATDLESVLRISLYDQEQRNELFHKCIRLAVLLSFADCSAMFKRFNVQPHGDMKKVLVVISTSNCLVIFRCCPVKDEDKKDTKEAVNGDVEKSELDAENKEASEKEDGGSRENTEHDLLSALCPGKTDLNEMIDQVIEDIHELLTTFAAKSGHLPKLLKSVAPPDWIAMLLARIVASK